MCSKTELKVCQEHAQSQIVASPPITTALGSSLLERDPTSKYLSNLTVCLLDISYDTDSYKARASTGALHTSSRPRYSNKEFRRSRSSTQSAFAVTNTAETAAMEHMAMAFTTSQSTPLYSTSWTPTTDGAYAGTCIFLVLLGTTLRLLFASKALLEQRWAAQARNRRYIVVRGREPEAERIDQDPDAKSQALLTPQGIEERVKVVEAPGKPNVPFRLSVDIPRALLTMVIAGVAYLL